MTATNDNESESVVHPPKEPGGPYHDFWLFAEGEREYSDYMDLLGRKDAPLRVPDEVLGYFNDWFKWMRLHNPGNPKEPTVDGFNPDGPTIVTQENGRQLREICEHFRSIYLIAPDPIILTGYYCCDIDEQGVKSEGYYDKLLIEKKWIVGMFTTLSEFAAKVEDGTHFIIHLGI